ncbi:hypothetical protein BSL78_00798 [Apostichopus japonicus]|uniref:Uncharacterized protein n=1 Tax=Stichopus japonicus TaxID=307972 RepID=A0A2G8LPV5_STIJA|nr:hypothetical protein BSL78_00798 [Apostichopus japonicus]
MTSNMGTVEVLRPTPIVEDVSIGTAAELTATTKKKSTFSSTTASATFSVLTCARNGLLSLFIVFLGFLFLMRIYNVHRHNHRYYHQMFVYSIAVIECILVTVHWVYMHMIQVEAIVQYLRLVQLLVICHFYLSRATRLLRWERSKIFLLIAMGLFFMYFTSIVIVTIVAASTRQTTTLMSCRDPFWLFLSIAECVLVQMFLISGFYITKRMNQVVTLESSRRSQIFDLWSIICAFEVASIASLVYNIVMLTEANGSNCSDVYNSNELIYSVVYIFLMIFTIFIPLLTLLLVFHPIDRETDENRPLLPSRSVFQPAFLSRADHQRIYRVGRRVSYSESSIQAPPQPSGQYRQSLIS